MSTEIRYNTADELRAKAAEIELSGVNFLKEDGSFANGNVKQVHRAEFIFIDGTKFVITSETAFNSIDDIEFKLRPSENNA